MLHPKAGPRCSAVIAFLSATIVAAQAQSLPELYVPYVPTKPEAVTAMLKLANTKSTDVVFDLGCGDGRIVIAAAERFGARGIGIDIDPVRIAEAKENAKRAGVADLVRFEESDFFQTDIHEASVVTLFLLPSVNLKLRPKLIRELRPGARIVSNTFTMGDWKPEKEVTLNSGSGPGDLSHKLYLWVVPQHR